ncbi:hypothetical protein GOODEAATRI_007075 [Goodea atripinnis]|uniref:Secreted protein n=1 Tax=Goodea atripinnis TaxID=208336 RepID=A0ABV0MZB6_9TELE
MAQDGVAQVLLGIALQLIGIQQGALHFQNPFVSHTFPSAHNFPYNLSRILGVDTQEVGGQMRARRSSTSSPCGQQSVHV